MAGERVKLVVRERTKLGSAETRRLRRQGLVPGVLYGRGKEPHAICIPERELRHALTGEAGLHAILDVVVEGKASSHASVIKEYQQDVVRGGITHVDLHEVRLDQPIQATVSLHLVGESAGTKAGGVLTQALNELSVEALPMEMPHAIELDVSEMEVGDSLRVGDVAAPAGATILDDPEVVVASVTLPTRVEEPEEVLAEGEEGELEGVPAEEQPEGAAEGAAEPEADAAGEHQPAEG
ncbi:MAG TPA: 50S ribosomal protein L25 [Gaiellaceae bacterium]|nr:50S ribosomal protein L25 [Gaiellaceae bacterium]